jgi:O-antigen ligase
VVALLANLFNSSFEFVFKDFRNFFGGLLIVIFLPAIIKDLKDLRFLSGVAVIVLTASTIVALMQHYNILGTGQYLAVPGRSQGFSENELELSYLLGVAIIAILGVYILEGMKTGRHRLLLPAILMLAALYFTYTRSAILALAFGLASFFLSYKIRIRSEIILVAILLVTLYLSVSGVVDNFTFSARSEVSQEGSSISRKILWQAGIAIAMDNPILGIGGDQYKTVAPQYTESVDPELIEWEEGRYYTYRSLGTVAIHNDYLNMWVSYGIVALIAFIWIMLAVLRNLIDSYSMSSQPFIKGLSLGLIGGLITYTVNAFYHNLLTEFSLLWIIAGFSMALVKLAAQDKGLAPVPKSSTPAKSLKKE